MFIPPPPDIRIFPLARMILRGDAGYRKRKQTTSSGKMRMPSVALLTPMQRQHPLTMPRIACSAFPCERNKEGDLGERNKRDSLLEQSAKSF